MATWRQVTIEAPGLATDTRRVLDAHPFKLLATVDRPGAPHIWGIEISFLEDDLWFGSMPASVKSRHLAGDPRLAIHSAPTDPDLLAGDAKVMGRSIARTAEEWSTAGGSTVPPGGGRFYTVDITALVLTRVDGDELVVVSWRQDRGIREERRR